MRPILDRLCAILMIEYNYKNTHIFKDDGCTHVGLFADELEDTCTFPECKGSLVLGDRNDVDEDNNIKAQSLTIKFMLMKAIRELHDEIKY